MNDFPTPETVPPVCQNCKEVDHLRRIEEKLALILKIVDTTAKAVLELKNTNGGNHARR